MLRKKHSFITPVLLIVSILFLAGCQKKEEAPVKQTPVVTDTSAKISQTVVPAPVDIKGKYAGTFDNHSSSLNIKEQDGNKFKGSLTVNYREVINQQVSGEFDQTTLKFSMTDLLHSRFQGKYSGKFSDDKTKMSGTFTMNLDGSKFSFNYTKK